MSLKSLETKWKIALTAIVGQLKESEFKKMLFDLKKIPQGVKCDKIPVELAQIIIQYYGVLESISVIEKVMKQIPRMDADVQDRLRPHVEKLKQIRQKEREKNKKSAASQSGAKKTQPAAGRKRKRDSVEGDKQPAADQQKIKPDKAPVAEVKPTQKVTEKQDCSLNLFESSETLKIDPVSAVKPKKKKTQKQDLSLEASESTKTHKKYQIIGLHQANISTKEISETTGASVRYVNRVIKAWKESGEPSSSSKAPVAASQDLSEYESCWNEVSQQEEPLPGGLILQPAVDQRCDTDFIRKKADLNLESNYHPTFESRLPTNTEVTLPPPDRRGREVWENDVEMIDEELSSDNVPESQDTFSFFFNSVSIETLKQLLEGLLQEKVITQEEMESVRRMNLTRTDRARALINLVTEKQASSVLIKILCRVDPFLARNLNLT